MAEEKFTVMFGERDAGNQKPVTGWVAGEMKVAKIAATAGSELKKNKPAPVTAFGSLETAEIQECYFVTVIAESEEEACLVVDKFLSQGFNKETGEIFTGGPSIKPFVNACGKAVAWKSSAFKEIAVL